MARGLTQELLAEALGIATKNAQRLEAGRQNLTLKTLEQVASILDVDPGELLLPRGTPVAASDAASLRRALDALERLGHQAFEPETEPPRGALPILSAEAAASRFGDARDVEVSGWLKLKGMRASQVEGRFVAMVIGHSMVPTIPNRALCLFRAPVTGPLMGRIVLAEWRDVTDPDPAGRYVVKRVGSLEASAAGGVGLTLLSDNRSYAPIEIPGERGGDFRIIAELERLLWPSRNDHP